MARVIHKVTPAVTAENADRATDSLASATIVDDDAATALSPIVAELFLALTSLRKGGLGTAHVLIEVYLGAKAASVEQKILDTAAEVRHWPRNTLLVTLYYIPLESSAYRLVDAQFIPTGYLETSGESASTLLSSLIEPVSHISEKPTEQP